MKKLIALVILCATGLTVSAQNYTHESRRGSGGRERDTNQRSWNGHRSGQHQGNYARRGDYQRRHDNAPRYSSRNHGRHYDRGYQRPRYYSPPVYVNYGYRYPAPQHYAGWYGDYGFSTGYYRPNYYAPRAYYGGYYGASYPASSAGSTVGTVIGAGLGAIIGHNNGRYGVEGAILGGLLGAIIGSAADSPPRPYASYPTYRSPAPVYYESASPAYQVEIGVAPAVEEPQREFRRPAIAVSRSFGG